jgi:glycosyltransferase involved in cell wall biosynthesis
MMYDTAPRPAQRYRIALLDSWLQTAMEGSGTAVAIGGLGEELRRQGHQVDRITPQIGRLPITLRRLWFNLTLPFTFDSSAYDVVVGFDFDGVWLPRKRPYLCSIKGIIAEELQHERGRVRLLFQLLAKFEGRNARRADRVITTSEYCRQRIVEHYGVPADRIRIVPEGIDLAAWEAAFATIPLHSDHRPTILCVARQYPRKHITDLLHAFALLRPYLPSAQLRLVGDGPEHSKLVALAVQLRITDSVHFLGGITDAEVKCEYVHCDVFCLPSVQEGFGIVFLEAMAAGKPIVSITATAIPEVVRHGETGILVPPSDVHSLAGALLVLLTNEEQRKRYGADGQHVVTGYDWSQVADIFMQEIESLLQPERRIYT